MKLVMGRNVRPTVVMCSSMSEADSCRFSPELSSCDAGHSNALARRAVISVCCCPQAGAIMGSCLGNESAHFARGTSRAPRSCARRSELMRFRQVFRQVDAAQQQIRVLDWGVANATLEEVFIKFAQSIGAEGGS